MTSDGVQSVGPTNLPAVGCGALIKCVCKAHWDGIVSNGGVS